MKDFHSRNEPFFNHFVTRELAENIKDGLAEMHELIDSKGRPAIRKLKDYLTLVSQLPPWALE